MDWRKSIGKDIEAANKKLIKEGLCVWTWFPATRIMEVSCGASEPGSFAVDDQRYCRQCGRMLEEKFCFGEKE